MKKLYSFITITILGYLGCADLLYEEKPFNTFKGNKVLIPMMKSQNQFIKKIDSEFSKKNSNFIRLIFFSNDIDDNQKKTIFESILNFVDTDTLHLHQFFP